MKRRLVAALSGNRVAREARNLRAKVRGEPNLAALKRQGLKVEGWVYAGRWTVIDPGFCWLISIGKNTVIGPRVTILAHDASTRVHLGYSRLDRVQIGESVFIGTHAVILPGTTIGDGAIIGAGSIVRGNVPARTVFAGNPARQIATVEEYLARHRVALSQRPHYPFAGYTVAGGITEDRKHEMLAALADGPGYVE